MLGYATFGHAADCPLFPHSPLFHHAPFVKQGTIGGHWGHRWAREGPVLALSCFFPLLLLSPSLSDFFFASTIFIFSIISSSRSLDSLLIKSRTYCTHHSFSRLFYNGFCMECLLINPKLVFTFFCCCISRKVNSCFLLCCFAVYLSLFPADLSPLPIVSRALESVSSVPEISAFCPPNREKCWLAGWLHRTHPESPHTQLGTHGTERIAFHQHCAFVEWDARAWRSGVWWMRVGRGTSA